MGNGVKLIFFFSFIWFDIKNIYLVNEFFKYKVFRKYFSPTNGIGLWPH